MIAFAETALGISEQFTGMVTSSFSDAIFNTRFHFLSVSVECDSESFI